MDDAGGAGESGSIDSLPHGLRKQRNGRLRDTIPVGFRDDERGSCGAQRVWENIAGNLGADKQDTA